MSVDSHKDMVRAAVRKAIGESTLEEGWLDRVAARVAEQLTAPVHAEVTELRLCESRYLALKPDQLYRFTVDAACAGCRDAAHEASIQPPGDHDQIDAPVQLSEDDRTTLNRLRLWLPMIKQISALVTVDQSQLADGYSEIDEAIALIDRLLAAP